MRKPARVRSSKTSFLPCGTNADTLAALSRQESSASVDLPQRISVIGTYAPVSASTTRVSPVTHLPRHTVKTLRGILKYSTVLASAKEFGGMMQTGPLKSTKDFTSNFFGSTMVELMLVKILKSSAQRTSYP